MATVDVNPYQSPAAETPRVIWRARFRWLCIRSLVLAAVFFALSRAIEYAAPDSFYDYALFLIGRGIVAFCTLTTMTTSGLFGIGWALSQRPPAIAEERG